MHSADIIEFCSSLEGKLDTVLFRQRREDDPNSVDHYKTVGGAAATGAAAIGAVAAKRAVSNRMGGLRATEPGFAGMGRGRQAVESAADLMGQRARVAGAIDATQAVPGMVRRGVGRARTALNPALGRLGSLLARIRR